MYPEKINMFKTFRVSSESRCLNVEASESNVLLKSKVNNLKWFPLVFGESVDGADAAQVST